MEKVNKPKKQSTYEMLKKLDKKVEKEASEKKTSFKPKLSENPKPVEERRKKPPESPRNRDFFRQSFKKKPDTTDYDPDIPDRSYGDLYCKACDSHMNSEQMWEAHIQGKRHQKHVKKGESPDNKYEIINKDPIVWPEIKNSKEILIGLNHCCEIQRNDGKPIYQCYLCSSNLPNFQQFIEHVIGLRHRMTYLKEHDPVKHDLISKTDLKKGMIEPVVADCIRLHQEKHGHGAMQVKREKAKPPGSDFNDFKRPFKDDYEPPKKRRDDWHDKYPDRYDDRDWRRSPDRSFDRDRSYLDSDRRYSPYSRSDVSDSNWAPVDNIYLKDEPRRLSSPPPQSSYPDRMDTSYPGSTWRPTTSEDPQLAVERNKVQEKSQSSNTNLFQSILTVIDNMPSVLFLELVLRRLENMDPTEAELSLLQKIGNHMISIVMNKKLQNLSPDLLNKYQQSVSAKSEAPTHTNIGEKSNFSSLMNMIDRIKTSSSPSNPSTWNSYSDIEPNPGREGPAFMTQSSTSFYDSRQAPASETYGSSSGIPGLTLSSSSENEPSSSLWNSYPARSSYSQY